MSNPAAPPRTHGSGSFFAVLLVLLLAPLTAATLASAQQIISASPDVTVDFGAGIIAADEDVVVNNQLGVVLLENLGRLPSSSEGLDFSLDIDAVQDLGGGAFLVFFDTTGSIGRVVFADEGVLRFNGTSWSLELDSSALAPAWAAADLDALAVPEPGGVLGLVVGCVGLAAVRRRRRDGARLE